MLNFTQPYLCICSNTIKLDEKLGAGEDMEFCKHLKVFFLCTDHCTPVQYCAANTFLKNIISYSGILFISHYKRKKCIKMKNLEYFSHSSLPVA